MSREQELTESLLEAYQRTGEDLGYWAARFREAVKRKGGLATARRMLRPRSPEQRKGLDVLLNAGRPELTTEAILLQPKFRIALLRGRTSSCRRASGTLCERCSKSRKKA